MQHSQSGPGE